MNEQSTHPKLRMPRNFLLTEKKNNVLTNLQKEKRKKGQRMRHELLKARVQVQKLKPSAKLQRRKKKKKYTQAPWKPQEMT